jgi:hypothetical protein
VLFFGAPDSVRCPRPYNRYTSHTREFGGALCYNSPDYPVCHRTVRCASGATVPCAPMALCKSNSAEQCRDRSQSAEVRGHRTVRCGTGLSGVAPDCPVQLKDKRPQRSTAQNPNGCADVARTGQCTVTVRWRTGLSDASIVSRIQPTARSGWEAINTHPTTSFTTIQAF